MKTIHKKKLMRRMEQEGKKWRVLVETCEAVGNGSQGMMATVRTRFDSTTDELEQVLHKIELDLMTSLHFGFKNPLKVWISEAQ